MFSGVVTQACCLLQLVSFSSQARAIRQSRFTVSEEYPQHLCRFIDGQASEKAQFHYPSFALVCTGEGRKGLIQGE